MKEQATGAYAAALAGRGIAALAFDHRTFGESGGEPRQFENPFAKIQDIQAAVKPLRSMLGNGPPLIGVGICAGAGYMAQAIAEDHRFDGFAAVAGYFGPASTSASAPSAKVERGLKAEARWRSTGDSETIPAVAADNGDVAMPLREAYEYYGTSRGAVPNYVNGFAVQSFAYTGIFDSLRAAPNLRVPTLIVHSENALAPTFARAFAKDLKMPSRQLWLESSGQIDFYDDPRLIGAACDAIAEFFRQAAKAGRSGTPTMPAKPERANW